MDAAMAAPPNAGTAQGGTGQWTIHCVDCPKQFSDMTDRSLRLDAAGHPHIAYGGEHLYYAWHDGVNWHYETVDDSPGVGTHASLALDADGRPHISYYDRTNSDLKYALWTGSAWSIQTVDSVGYVGRYSCLALDAGGHPHISYQGDGDLKYAVGPLQPDLSPSAKIASKTQVQAGDTITYTIRLVNSGALSTTFTLTDAIPLHTTYVPGSAWAGGGDITDTDGITWAGTITGSTSLTATFEVTVSATVTERTAIVNVATLTGDPDGPLTLRAGTFINPLETFLPLMFDQE